MNAATIELFQPIEQTSSKCKCGTSKLSQSIIDSIHDENSSISFVCISCEEKRLEDLKNKYNRINQQASTLYQTIKKYPANSHEWFSSLGNVYMRIGIDLYGAKKFEQILDKMKNSITESL